MMKELIKTLKSDWSNDHPDQKLHLTTLLVMVAVVMLLVAAPVFLMKFPARDVAFRYAPMAEAFAEGNFFYAFHPRIPMLHTVLAGCVAFLTGSDGFTACRIVSALFYVAGVLPLAGMVQRVFNRRTAMISAIIYACSSPLMQLGYSGLRDSAKSFLLLLMAYALVRIYQEREQWGGYVALGIAGGMAFLVRVDVIILAGLLLWAMFFLECRHHRLAVKSLAGSLLAVVIASPAFIQNYLQIGVAVPDSYTAAEFIELTGRHAKVREIILFWITGIAGLYLSALLLSMVKIKHLLRGSAVIAAIIIAGGAIWLKKHTVTWENDDGVYWRVIFFSGFSSYGILAVPGIILRLYRREWRREETLLILLFLTHILVVLGQFILFKKQFYVSDRYLESALPLIFCWAAYVTVLIWQLLDYSQKKWQYPRWCVRMTATILIAVPIGIYLFYAYVPAVQQIMPGQKKKTMETLQEIAGQIRKNGISDERKKSGKINLKLYEPPYCNSMTYLEFRRGKWIYNRHHNAIVAYFAEVRLTKKQSDYILYVWKKNEKPGKMPLKRKKLLYKTDDGEKEYQLWSAKR